MHLMCCLFNTNILLLLTFIDIIGADANRTLFTEERDLNDKVVVITGAAQGIGYAIGDHFLKEGVRVVIILDINTVKGIDAATKLNQKYGECKAVFIECDVTKDLEDVANNILEQYGYVDVLVNNAGIVDTYNARKTIITNTVAPIEWSILFWQHMRIDKGGCGGTIINISAVFGYTINPFALYYKSATSATIEFSRSLGHELNYKKTGVRVLVICPGYTYTLINSKQYLWDEELGDLHRMLKNFPRQSADDVGKGTVQVFQTAGSGTSWDISGGEPPAEAPIIHITTLADIVAS